MATQFWSTAYAHTSDATFRTWGLELSTKLAAAGMIQTADTGQINWGTVTRAAAGSVAGYEVWKLPDGSFHLKLEYGTKAADANAPMMWFTIGEGSDGAGNLTGTTSTRQTTHIGNSGFGLISSTVTAYPSYLCVTNDFFGLIFKAGSLTGTTNGHALVGITFGKILDTAGAVANVGYIVTNGSAQGGNRSQTDLCRVQAIRTAATTRVGVWNSSFCIVPESTTTSIDDTGANQAFEHSVFSPRLILNPWLVTVITAELPFGNQMTITPIGSTPRNFISIDRFGGCGNSGSASTTWGLAMLWE